MRDVDFCFVSLSFKPLIHSVKWVNSTLQWYHGSNNAFGMSSVKFPSHISKTVLHFSGLTFLDTSELKACNWRISEQKSSSCDNISNSIPVFGRRPFMLSSCESKFLWQNYNPHVDVTQAGWDLSWYNGFCDNEKCKRVSQKLCLRNFWQ